MRRFVRARKPEQKDARRRAILDAARDLANEVGPIELSLNELGRRSGVSKPNIYRYFESREDVLLQLFVREIDEVVSSVERGLSKLRARGSVAAIAKPIARAFVARPLACQLLVMVASILEHNLSVEAIAASKREIHASSFRCAAALSKAMPSLSEEDALWATYTIAIQVAGLWPAAHPSANAALVLDQPEFVILKTEAQRDLLRFVEVLLTGLKRASRT